MLLSFAGCRDRKAEAEEREKNLVEIEVEQKEKAQDVVDEYNKNVQDVQEKATEVDGD
jgi:hypothetical protein